MKIVLFAGFITGLALLFGAVIGLYAKLHNRFVAALIAFGSGMMLGALSLGMLADAIGTVSQTAIAISLLVGGLTFIGGDYLLHISGGRGHRQHQPIPDVKDEPTGQAIILGTILDGIPESIALGVGLATDQTLGILLIIAIIAANIPESLSSIIGLREQKFSDRKIIGVWATVGLTVLFATIIGYLAVPLLSEATIGTIEAFAAGAILAMLADTMIPEAYQIGGFAVGLMTVIGFIVAFIIA